MPSDFRVRTLDGVADDWPLTYEDLEPYYVRSSATSGSPGWPATRRSRPAKDPPLPPVPLGPGGPKRVARAHNELGWHWWPAPLAIATRQYGAAEPVRPARHLPAGCARRRQGHRRPAPTGRGGLELGRRAAHRRPRRALVTRAGRASSAARSTSTRRRRARGPRRVTILAANGIGTPRLLLLSGGSPDGLANSSGLRRQAADDAPVRHRRRRCSTRTSAPGRARGASTSTRSSSTRPTRRAGSCAAPSGGCSRPGGPFSMTSAYPWGAENADLGRGLPATRCAGGSGTRRCGGSSPRTCPRSPTASCSIRDRHRRSTACRRAKIDYRLSENSRRLVDFHQASARASRSWRPARTRWSSRRSSARPAGTCSARR